MGYGYRQIRKKGLLSRVEIRNRLRNVCKIKRLHKGQNKGSMKLWIKQINMYLNGVEFEYKQNLYKHAQTPNEQE